jgi:cyclic beta-1,2-glucan synthetase
VALESMLGLQLRGDRLRIEPCIAPHWPRFELTYHHRSATYHITIENPAGVERGVKGVTLDGKDVPGGVIELRDDGGRHEVRVVMG